MVHNVKNICACIGLELAERMVLVDPLNLWLGTVIWPDPVINTGLYHSLIGTFNSYTVTDWFETDLTKIKISTTKNASQMINRCTFFIFTIPNLGLISIGIYYIINL